MRSIDGLRLRPEQIFGGLLDAGVQIADLGLGLDDVLALDLEHDLQHAVRRRMLRPHREHHRVAVLANDLRRQRLRRTCSRLVLARASTCFLQRFERAPRRRRSGDCTLLLSANAGRGERSRAGPRIG